MTDTSSTPTVAPRERKATRSKSSAKAAATQAARDHAEDGDFARAQRDAAAQSRREMLAKITELKRKEQGARERAAKAKREFETGVALMASEKPERVDWYEYEGPLPRKQLLDATGINTVTLHRIMERYRKDVDAKKKGGRR